MAAAPLVPLGGFANPKTEVTCRRNIQADPNYCFTRKHYSQVHPTEGVKQSICLVYNSFNNHIDNTFFDDFLPVQQHADQRDLYPDDNGSLLRHPTHDNIFTSMGRGKHLHHYLDDEHDRHPPPPHNTQPQYDYRLPLGQAHQIYTYNAELNQEGLAAHHAGAIAGGFAQANVVTEMESFAKQHFMTSLGRGVFQLNGIGISYRGVTNLRKRNQFNLEFKFAFKPDYLPDILTTSFHDGPHPVWEVRMNIHFDRAGLLVVAQNPDRICNSADLIRVLSENLVNFQVRAVPEITRPQMLDLDEDKLEEVVTDGGHAAGYWRHNGSFATNQSARLYARNNDLYFPQRTKNRAAPMIPVVAAPIVAPVAALVIAPLALTPQPPNPLANNQFAALAYDSDSD